MATKDATNTRPLPQFSSLIERDRVAVIMKCAGHSNHEIAAAVSTKQKKVAANTVRDWFGVNNRLEQARLEYLEISAEASLKEARIIAMHSARAALNVMNELMGLGHEPKIRLGAARALANKYIPDRQVILDQRGGTDELPAELQNAADSILNGNTSPADPILDDPRESEGDSSSPGGTGSENLPTEVL